MKTLVVLALVLAWADGVVAQTPSSSALAPYEAEDWRDPSPHQQLVVHVADSVRLEVLDWGGAGLGLVFLPGTGMSAHLFDDLAPAFRGRFHVVGLTPRGQGRSATPTNGYAVAQESADLGAVLDSLGIRHAILVGHSLGGSVITAYANEHPDRVAGLVYLDATMDYAGLDSVEAHNPVKRPSPEGGFKTADEYRAWLARYFFGTWTNALEADFRATLEAPQANTGRRQDFVKALVQDAAAHPKAYKGLDCPAISLWGQKTATNLYPWLTTVSQSEKATAQQYVSSARVPWERAGVDRFRREFTRGRVVPMRGAHYFYITNRDSTLEVLKTFLAHAVPAAGR